MEAKDREAALLIEREASRLLPRARQGDGEALDALLVSIRMPFWDLTNEKVRRSLSTEDLFRVLELATLDAIVLWGGEDTFLVQLDKCLGRRLSNLWMGRQTLLEAVMSEEAVKSD